jgi:hypothetical protein
MAADVWRAVPGGRRSPWSGPNREETWGEIRGWRHVSEGGRGVESVVG